MPYAPGQKFGHLTIIERLPDYITPKGAHKLLYLCECDCEKHTRVKVTAMHLASGHTTSCGCESARLSAERLAQRDRDRAKHGLYNTRIYKIWVGMIDRCYNPNCSHYQNYGGRGIKICSEWYNPNNPLSADNLRNFWNWAIMNGYRDDLSIDRNNVDGDYCPENCSWESAINQMNNTRSIKYVTFNGSIMSIGMVARALGIDENWLYVYAHRNNYNISNLFTPINTIYGTVPMIFNGFSDVIPYNAIYYLSPSGYVIPQNEYAPPAPQPALWAVDPKGFVIGPYPEDPNYYPPIPSVIPNV